MNLSTIFIVIAGMLMVIVPVMVFAQQMTDVAQMASLIESLKNLVQDLAKKVQNALPIVLASLQGTDLTQDGLTGENDWVYMRDRWFTDDASADINGDGIVNSVDFGLLNRNWNKTVQ